MSYRMSKLNRASFGIFELGDVSFRMSQLIPGK